MMMTVTMTNQRNGLTTVDLLVSLEEVLLDETHAALTALEGSLAWKTQHKSTRVTRGHVASKWNWELFAPASIHSK